MKRTQLVVAVFLLTGASVLFQREFLRGTFDSLERAFVGWLSANAGAKAALPPLTLVLYDQEDSSVAGAPRMGALDVALFTRAAAKLGAVGAGVEGLAGDPVRMLEAAGRLPVFAGYGPESPPGRGWTPLDGVPSRRWKDLPGLAGPRSTRLPIGFFAVPEGESGPRRATLVARNSDCVVPSFLALSWSAAQRLRPADVSVEANWLKSPVRSLPIDAEGKVSFFRAAPGSVMSMNELLVAAEKYERGEAESVLRGRLVVLARATSDITRLKNSLQGEETTPAQLWAEAWAALRQGRSFVLPGWWYHAVLVAAAVLLSARAIRARLFACSGMLFAALLVYSLFALGAFASAGLLLPLVPSVGILVLGTLLGRFAFRL